MAWHATHLKTVPLLVRFGHCKWSLQVLHAVCGQSSRFGALARDIGGFSVARFLRFTTGHGLSGPSGTWKDLNLPNLIVATRSYTVRATNRRGFSKVWSSSYFLSSVSDFLTFRGLDHRKLGLFGPFSVGMRLQGRQKDQGRHKGALFEQAADALLLHYPSQVS